MIRSILDFISESIDGGNGANALLFFRLRNDDSTFTIKKVNAVDDAQTDLLNKYCQVVSAKLSRYEPQAGADPQDNWNLANIDDYDYTSQKTLYYFENNIEANMEFLSQDHCFEADMFNIADVKKIDGVIIRIGNAEKYVNLYIPYFPTYGLDRDTWFIMKKMNEQFVSNENENFIRFNYQISFVYFENKLLILDFKKLENKFKFADKMVERAKAKVEIFKTNGLLSENSTLESLIDTNSSLRNKLLKIKETSPVFSVDKNVLVGFVRDVNNKLKINIADDGKFDVVSMAKAKVFLRIMDDDYVKSNLTGKIYEAEKKSEMSE